jgi:chromosome partitioning protein
MSPRVVTVANYKGGSSKTTTSVFLAHALAERHLRVVLVDADPQASASRWRELAGAPFVTIAAMPVTQLDRQLWRTLDPDRWDVAVIDCPPQEEREGIVVGAVRAATDVLVPLAPTMAEYDRIGPTIALLHGEGVRNARAVLTRTVPNASSTEVYRMQLAADGLPVLPVVIPRREAYAQALGDTVPARDVPYGLVAEYLTDSWKAITA